ncbi:MAG: hypothetical protein B7Z10_08845 [Rhodobacterales bacterium 32-66-7]|nr:MAG: hypothetical protein B7Z31_05355 [Rhodobacterales bacterium 12-65-15]OYX24603.1 MAG: hypothetical protein B7Z10_08845 [Rhodobacterales bacterium 32-66-7]
MQTALEELLDQTHAAALAGDVTALASLAPRVEALAGSLGTRDAGVAERLRRKARLNLTLLAAATQGVRAAQARFGDILAGPTLTTYDASGRKAAIAALSLAVPRRC